MDEVTPHPSNKEITMIKQKDTPRDGNGHFKKGASGNLAGRPPGSRNRATLLMETLLEEGSERLTRKAIDLATAGDVQALRLCLERLLPARKDRLIELDLRPVGNSEQLADSVAKVVEAIATGQITPGEGEILANILVSQNTVMANRDLQHRIEKLEQSLSHESQSDDEPSDIAQRLNEGRNLAARLPEVANERVEP